jgi:copper chaperone
VNQGESPGKLRIPAMDIFARRCVANERPSRLQRGRQTMEEPRKDLLMQVEGMTCQGCVNSVTKAIQRLDPGAEVEVDLEHGRVHVVTTAQTLEVAQALDAAGYEATAMTM